jgi:hypothetical protein
MVQDLSRGTAPRHTDAQLGAGTTSEVAGGVARTLV